MVKRLSIQTLRPDVRFTKKKKKKKKKKNLFVLKKTLRIELFVFKNIENRIKIYIQTLQPL